MSEKVLLVDDDPNILKAYQRRLRKRFEVETALCSEEGVTAASILGPFAVVVSDMKMPRESGAEFLAKMLKAAPDCVRIMLTGNADQQAAADAVNLGQVFRFLNKPCPAETLEQAIADGIAEHHRLREQRELIGKTAHGCVAMLTKLLSLADPIAFGRAERLAELARNLAESAGREDPWELETAALLSQLGVFTLSSEMRDRRDAEGPVSDNESELWENQYLVAADMIREAPQFAAVARIIELQGDATPLDTDEDRTVQAAELLRVALEFDRLQFDGHREPTEAFAILQGDPKGIGAAALEALESVAQTEEARRLAEVDLVELADGMRLIDDVVTTAGMMLVAHGQEVTASLRKRLDAYSESHSIQQPLRVLLPAGWPTDANREELAPA